MALCGTQWNRQTADLRSAQRAEGPRAIHPRPLLRRAGPLRSHPRSRRATPCPPTSPAPARVVPRRQRRNPLVDVGLTAARDPNQLPVVRRSRNDLDRIPRHPQQLREEGNEVGVRLAPLGGWRDVGADLPARKPSDPLRGGAGSGPDPQHHALERTRVRHGGILERRRASTANAGGASAGLWAR